jgi:diadenosine tetraphosphate (Ap4A) HIT family hydrolase
VAAAQHCPFCEIIIGQRHQEIVYTSDEAAAFLCEPPAVWGHILVVPRRHVTDIWGIELSELSAITAAAKRLADALRIALAADGISLRQNSGDASGQDVFHFHLHVIPRYEGDVLGRACSWGVPPWTPPEGGEKERKRIAAAIRHALA